MCLTPLPPLTRRLPPAPQTRPVENDAKLRSAFVLSQLDNQKQARTDHRGAVELMMSSRAVHDHPANKREQNRSLLAFLAPLEDQDRTAELLPEGEVVDVVANSGKTRLRKPAVLDDDGVDLRSHACVGQNSKTALHNSTGFATSQACASLQQTSLRVANAHVHPSAIGDNTPVSPRI